MRKPAIFATLLGLLLTATAASARTDMAALIEASKKEDGLKIHANVGKDNWPGIVAAFTRKYPWIRTQPIDNGPIAAFERYFTETAAGLHSADVLVVASPGGWIKFVERGGVEPYDAVEGGGAPSWSRPFPGVYTFSTDPLLLLYNKRLLPTPPRTLAELATQELRFTTYDARLHPFAEAVHLTYVQRRGWDVLEKLAPRTHPENAGDTIFDEVAAGKYAAGYFMTGVLTFLQIDKQKKHDTLGWALPGDGTPVIARGLAVTRNAASKASARLFVEFALSHEGQVAIGKAGLTPYRADLRPDEVPYLTYQAIVDRVGADNVLPVLFDRSLLDSGAFLARWNKIFNS